MDYYAQWIWNKVTVPYLRYNPSIYLEILRKTTKTSVGITSLFVKNQTQDLPSVKQEYSSKP
jgi:hypothetical protein